MSKNSKEEIEILDFEEEKKSPKEEVEMLDFEADEKVSNEIDEMLDFIDISNQEDKIEKNQTLFLCFRILPFCFLSFPRYWLFFQLSSSS